MRDVTIEELNAFCHEAEMKGQPALADEIPLRCEYCRLRKIDCPRFQEWRVYLKKEYG